MVLGGVPPTRLRKPSMRSVEWRLEPQYVLIGFFTLTIAAGGLLFVLWLAKAGDQQDYRLYDIVFREAVSGLSVGNAVEYSGIRVGEVKKLWLDPEDPRQVWARVSVTADTPIREDTKARLALANIAGTTNIQLTSDSLDSPPLKTAGDRIPRVVAEPSPLARLKVTGGRDVCQYQRSHR